MAGSEHDDLPEPALLSKGGLKSLGRDMASGELELFQRYPAERKLQAMEDQGGGVRRRLGNRPGRTRIRWVHEPGAFLGPR